MAGIQQPIQGIIVVACDRVSFNEGATQYPQGSLWYFRESINRPIWRPCGYAACVAGTSPFADATMLWVAIEALGEALSFPVVAKGGLYDERLFLLRSPWGRINRHTERDSIGLSCSRPTVSS